MAPSTLLLLNRRAPRSVMYGRVDAKKPRAARPSSRADSSARTPSRKEAERERLLGATRPSKG
eukprot:2273340-Alexandrium_andersonii.AAC.1